MATLSNDELTALQSIDMQNDAVEDGPVLLRLQARGFVVERDGQWCLTETGRLAMDEYPG